MQHRSHCWIERTISDPPETVTYASIVSSALQSLGTIAPPGIAPLTPAFAFSLDTAVATRSL